MTKSVLMAGVLGGVLGGLGAYLAVLWLKPVEAAPTNAGVATREPASPEARAVAEAFVSKLRTGKYDEFALDVKLGMSALPDKEFAVFKQKFEEALLLAHGVYGTPTGEVELIGETALTPNLARFVYLQKFPRGAMVWFFVLYNTPEGWRLNGIVFNKDLIHAFPSGS